MAAEQGRDVFAIPGSIHSPLSKGCHQLIKQGAKLVDAAQDILDELGILPLMSSMPVSEPQQQVTASGRLLGAVGYDPVHIEILAERTGFDIASLSAQLLEQELEGNIESLPGGMYRRLG
jgi:DNA processing protein